MKKKLPLSARKAVVVSEDNLVVVQTPDPGTSLPLLVRPAIAGVDLNAWARSKRDFVRANLLERGAILFRGFNPCCPEAFADFINASSEGKLLAYTNRSTPRTEIGGNIYTATEYPANQVIPLHNENSYQRSWPLKIYFLCDTPAQQGGATPLADSRKVFERIEPGIREHFAKKRVMYVRNYGDGLDLPWQSVFQTNDKSEVEAFCRRAGLEFEWKGAERLRTRQVCQAVAQHPETGAMVWFNQAHLFHVSSLAPDVREYLLNEFEEEELPRNAFHGDGTPIEASHLDAIRQAYREETTIFDWQPADILVLDNMLAAHGREPYVGSRKILVGMSELFDNELN